MSKANPESVSTKEFRRLLEARGAFTLKLSDSFTRGVPDLLVSTNRVVMVEMKQDFGTGSHRSYKTLGMSGAQDQGIRELCRRNPHSACVVGADPGNEMRCKLWSPVVPERSGGPFVWYALAAVGFEEVWSWLTIGSRI